MEKIYLKAPTRVERSSCDVPLPPSPTITRWGTWLEVAIYYCEYFKLILNVVQQLSAKDAIFIEKVRKNNVEENILKADSYTQILQYLKQPLKLRKTRSSVR